VKRRYGLGDWLLSRPFRDAQPAWSRKLFWFAGFPAWLGFGYFGVLESFDPHKTLALVCFGVFAAVALVQNYYFFTGGGRSDG
jgi:hypothetical protein